MLSHDELIRYDRQIKLLGLKNQVKLKKATVLVVGVGGLGTAASLYLAAAGVGKIILVDKDSVELSNLNRQILFWTEDIGKPKATAAKDKLEKLNPHVEIVTYGKKLTEDLARKLVRETDVVIDALDNWDTRFMLNKICVEERKPLIHAGVYGMHGQLLTIIPGEGPCLQCLIPKKPAEAGKFPVIGTTPGILALMQVTEAIKIITGYGKPAVGKLIIYDGERMSFNEILVKRRANCPVCEKLISP